MAVWSLPSSAGCAHFSLREPGAAGLFTPYFTRRLIASSPLSFAPLQTQAQKRHPFSAPILCLCALPPSKVPLETTRHQCLPSELPTQFHVVPSRLLLLQPQARPFKQANKSDGWAKVWQAGRRERWTVKMTQRNTSGAVNNNSRRGWGRPQRYELRAGEGEWATVDERWGSRPCGGEGYEGAAASWKPQSIACKREETKQGGNRGKCLGFLWGQRRAGL